MSCIDELDREYPVRNSTAQKQRFREYAKQLAEQAGYEARVEECKGHNNLIVGNPDQADVVFTAHYDTPRRAVFPNIMMPTNRVLHFIYTFGTILPLLLLALGAGRLSVWLAFRYGAGLSEFESRLLLLTVYLAVYFGLYLLLFRGPANRANKNDNTSGVAAVLDLIRKTAPSGKAAFILFDDEEKGKKGSKAYAALYPGIRTGKLIVNMDCVGNGETFVVVIPKAAENDPAVSKLKKSMKAVNAKIFSPEEASLNSDQRNFEKGIGICASLQKKGIGFYTPRIHTSRDTFASGKIIDELTGVLVRMIE